MYENYKDVGAETEFLLEAVFYVPVLMLFHGFWLYLFTRFLG